MMIRLNIQLITALLLGLILTNCAMDDADRCGNDDRFEYSPETGKCVLRPAGTTDETDVTSDTTSETDTGEEDGGTATDTGTHSDTGGDDYPTGMGETCKKDTDCAQFDATSCIVPHGEEWGSCTFTGCATSPDSCPGGWRCCKMPDQLGVPTFCIIEEKYPLQGLCQQ